MNININMKKIKIFAISMCVVVPVTSAIALGRVTPTVYATDTNTNVEETAGNTKAADTNDDGSGDMVITAKDAFTFHLNEDIDIYDYETKFEFEGTEYQGLYLNDIKKGDNTKLKIDDLGTRDNPYVVLEITPSASITQLRPHMGDQGLFDLTSSDVAAITLTDEDKLTVRINNIQYYFDKYDDKIKKLTGAEKAKLELEKENKIKDLTAEIAKLQARRDELSALIPQLKAQIDTIAGSVKEEQKNLYWESLKTKYGMTADWQIAGKIQEEYGKYLTLGSSSDDFYNTIPEYREQLDNALSSVDGYDALKEEYDAAVAELGENLADWQGGPTGIYKSIKDKQAELNTLNNTEIIVNVPDVAKSINERGVDENGNKKQVETVLSELEDYLVAKGLVSRDEYNERLELKYESAREYKINARKSEIYDSTVKKGYGFNYNYITQYAVKDGKFVINNTDNTSNIFSNDQSSKKRLDLTMGTEDSGTSSDSTVNAIYGEYGLTMDIINPLGTNENAIKGMGDSIPLYSADYSFAKSCLALGYDTKVKDGIIQSQTPHVDEYIFAGWYILSEGKLVSIDELDDDYDFTSVTDLYTAWSVRYYETNQYHKIITDPAEGENVSVDFGTKAYRVHLPSTIASNNSGSGHDARNQLTMCTPFTGNVLVTWSNDHTGYYKKEVSYTEETSAWDFYFRKDEYDTVDKIKQVAPKLMSDTDYFVMTYETVIGNNGKVDYYPYNVIIITASPEDLNKMVYYDYAKQGKSAESGYMESEYLNKFMNNVDFYITANGGSSIYLDGQNDTFRIHDLNKQTAVAETKAPNRFRAPSLYTYVDGQYVYDKSKVVTNASFGSTDSVSDLEWQVVYSMYLRILKEDKDSAGNVINRRAAIITDESLSDKIAGRTGAASVIQSNKSDDGKVTQSGGTQDNMAKFYNMLYACTDATLIYDYYVDPNYATEKQFDKMHGEVRSEVYRNSYFTGVLYGCENWNTNTFFPYENLGVDHYKAMFDGDIFGKYSPFNSTLGLQLWEAIGLSSYPNYKGIANPYAYTYNGDTHMTTSLYTYDITETSNVTNQKPNTKLAFDYFRGVSGRANEIKGGKIATKSAIEFMVQNVRNGIINYRDRKITILNKMDPQKKFTVGNKLLYVDKVIAEDYSSLTADVEYKYTGSGSGYFVVEYLYTPQFQEIDNDYHATGQVYINYTNKEEPELRWYVMPKSSKSDTTGSFITKRIVSQPKTEADGSTSTERTYIDNELADAAAGNNHIEKWTTTNNYEYVFNALIKPNVRTSADLPTYIIAVKQYSDVDSYKKGDSPVYITLKNVSIDKMSYLFNLD